MKRKLLRRVRGLRRPRRLVLSLTALVVLAGVAGGWLLFRGDEPAAATTTTATVQTQTLKQTVTASGTLAAATTADLSFDVSGTVTAVYVKPGDTVKKGQRLAAIDDDVLQAQLDAAQSSLTAARTARSENIADGAADVQLAADRAAVLAAESQLAEAQEAVDDAVLRSTTKGTVTAVGLEVGDSAGSAGAGAGSAGSSSGTDATGTITVVSTGRFVVDATVASADIAKVSVGLQAEITVSGVDETVYGTVQEVGLVAETDSSGAAVFPVTVQVTDTRDDLFGGTSADVAIVVSQRSDVLTVDSRALRTDGDTTYVEKVSGDSTERTEVEVGETSGLATEITSGLSEGDVVEIAGFTGPGSGGGDQQMQQLREQMQQNGGLPPGGFPGGGTGGFPGGGSR
ncbi:efflux RND transporter periplasmic adaptor subunit [Nocardioides nitrophenolicus]|uniref:efflux RND transporter periplasmic adaptor subunit n=1 Tax=Nocardioides nitrophenolicus TaxID=60489 RepID=UPI00195E6E66|nr:efflux RND transporter periplasmic adaptor subunit [Nocardioides nitrophenolicus]MBM7519811.1 macrolide-specific efflux system membrane fusion protein [Nocardioides nitrophenolicus]